MEIAVSGSSNEQLAMGVGEMKGKVVEEKDRSKHVLLTSNHSGLLHRCWIFFYIIPKGRINKYPLLHRDNIYHAKHYISFLSSN